MLDGLDAIGLRTERENVDRVILGLGPTPERTSPDRMAVGRYQPTAPTDPYVRTLAHTVPQIMASLRA